MVIKRITGYIRGLLKCTDSAAALAYLEVPMGAPGEIPAGVICMWGGLLANIPTGWQLCDGTNGTPDLRSKFIKGSATGVEPGVTGGAATHSHTAHSYTPAGTVSQPTFTGAALGSHSHGLGTYAVTAASAGTPAGTVAWPAGVPTFTGNAVGDHTHAVGTYAVPDHTNVSVPATATAAVKIGTGASNAAANSHTHTITTITHSAITGSSANGGAHTPGGTVAWPAGVPTFTGSALSDHGHSLSGSSEAVSAGTPSGTVSQPSFTGDAASLTHSTESNEPPYYSLAFIQKL